MPKALETSNPLSMGFSDAQFQDPPETSLFSKMPLPPSRRYRYIWLLDSTLTWHDPVQNLSAHPDVTKKATKKTGNFKSIISSSFSLEHTTTPSVRGKLEILLQPA